MTGRRIAGLDSIEVTVEPDTVVWASESEYRGPALRVRYRIAGQRRWVHFMLIPNEGETLEDLERYTVEAVLEHRRAMGARS